MTVIVFWAPHSKIRDSPCSQWKYLFPQKNISMFLLSDVPYLVLKILFGAPILEFNFAFFIYFFWDDFLISLYHYIIFIFIFIFISIYFYLIIKVFFHFFLIFITQGQTPLHLSILPTAINTILHFKDIIKILVDYGANINDQDGRGNTVLHRYLLFILFFPHIPLYYFILCVRLPISSFCWLFYDFIYLFFYLFIFLFYCFYRFHFCIPINFPEFRLHYL